MSTVERTYTYERNGKLVVVKRSWRNNETLTTRRNTLNDYFKNNKDDIQKMKNYITVFNDYNNKNPQHKVSYSTIVNKIHKVFGYKNKHDIVNNGDNQQVNTNDSIDNDDNIIL